MTKNNYYAVATGRRPGIYRRWSGAGGAEEQVKGFPEARYQGFRLLRDAQNWLRSQEKVQEPEPVPLPLEDDRPPHSPRRSLSPSRPRLVEPSETIGDRGAVGGEPAPAAKAPAQPQTIDHTRALAAGKVVIYTDGSCVGNPGPGGYGAVLLFGQHRKELSGGYRRTTNNRMELVACIVALQSLKRASTVVLYSDSRYVVDGISRGWARRWRENGWKRNEEAEALNADLWAQLLDLCDQHRVEFVWVRGHMGNTENERCDRLSVGMAWERNLPEDKGFEER